MMTVLLGYFNIYAGIFCSLIFKFYVVKTISRALLSIIVNLSEWLLICIYVQIILIHDKIHNVGSDS